MGALAGPWPLLLVGLAMVALAAADSAVQPFSFPPSLYWDGNDGPWSSFGVRVGTPAQNVRLLPSSGGSSIWVVLTEGCTKTDPTSCPEDRGNLFAEANSTSWNQFGTFVLPLTEEGVLGYSANAYAANDSLTLGWQNDVQLDVGTAMITGIASKDFFLGAIGLTPRPEYVKDFNDAHNSPLYILKQQNKIPSSSWGYTAGAYWTSPKTFGSLTLGGYDRSRFVPNDVSINFGSDFSRDLLVGVSSITAANGTSSQVLKSGIYSFVDSLVPHIWLPADACQAVVDAFGLVYNSTSELYLIPDEADKKLSAANASLTFRITPSLQNSQATVDITIPYGALALTASYPYFKNTTKRYFPLKKADNDTQYTLGRAFLQSAYILVDYERGNFSLSQALYPDSSVKKDIVSILPPGSSSNGSSSSSSSSNSNTPSNKLGSGAIAGIAVGAVVGIVALGVGLFFCFFRRRRQTKQKPHELAANALAADAKYGDNVELSAEETARHELLNPAEVFEMQAKIAPAGEHRPVHELPDERNVYLELDGGGTRHVIAELEASPVSRRVSGKQQA